MSKQVHFFASIIDLQQSAKMVDTNMKIQLVPNQLSETEKLDIYFGVSSIPNLGKNLTGRPVGAGSFFVLSADQDVPVRRVKMAYDQGIRYEFDMDDHQRWIYFEPGGETTNETTRKFIVGKVGIGLVSKDSNKLYKAFKKEFTKGYKRTGNRALIAPEALKVQNDSDFIW